MDRCAECYVPENPLHPECGPAFSGKLLIRKPPVTARADRRPGDIQVWHRPVERF